MIAWTEADRGTSPLDSALQPLTGLIGWAEVDGVPALYAPTPGPLNAGLVFRVGTADETLATAGITHLVEHLALFDQNLVEVHHNGQTAETYTFFHVTGDASEVVRFMERICAALRDLPVERLETEKTILRTEAANRAQGVGALRLWRYGPRGLGLSGYDELGLSRLDAAAVRSWARTYFTRDNAVFFVTGEELPERLALDLPAGTRMPVPTSPSALPQTPAFFCGREGRLLLDAELPRSTEASVFSRIAGRRLFRDLRQEGGYSYTAGADYLPWSGDRATVRLYADALPDHQDAALGAFVDAVAALRRVAPEDDELEVVRRAHLGDLDLPDRGARLLLSTALNLLWGAEIVSTDEQRARYEAVTGEDVRRVGEQLWADALVEAPTGSLEWAGTVAAPQWSTSAVSGTRFPRAGDETTVLVLGEEGVSLVSSRGPVTVRFDECEAMSTRPDGARYLVGSDGFWVPVEPTLHPRLTADVVARLLDARVPADRVIPLAARDPEEIPQPPASSGTPLLRRVGQALAAPVRSLGRRH